MRLSSAITLVIARSKSEILADIADGTVPATVATFSELHDYVDANCYGGLCDDECPPEVWDAGAEIQEAVHQWLVAGRP